MSDEKQQALFETWADHAFGPSTKLPQTERFTSYWKCWQAAIASQKKPAQLVSDKEYLRIFDEARHGSPNPVGLMRGIRACIAAYELAQPKPAPVLLTKVELERLCVEEEFLLFCSQDEFNDIAKTVESAVHRKSGWCV